MLTRRNFGLAGVGLVAAAAGLRAATSTGQRGDNDRNRPR